MISNVSVCVLTCCGQLSCIFNFFLLFVFLSSVDPTDQKKTSCYDIDVEVDDPLKGQMNSFLSSTTNQQEIAALEMKVHTACRHSADFEC